MEVYLAIHSISPHADLDDVEKSINRKRSSKKKTIPNIEEFIDFVSDKMLDDIKRLSTGLQYELSSVVTDIIKDDLHSYIKYQIKDTRGYLSIKSFMDNWYTGYKPRYTNNIINELEKPPGNRKLLASIMPKYYIYEYRVQSPPVPVPPYG